MRKTTGIQVFSQVHTNEELYLQQVETLKLFLERNAISKEQYEKSLHDLTEKMGMSDCKTENS